MELQPDTLRELDDLSHRLLGQSFDTLRKRAREADDAALDQGGAQGWRPSGPEALALRVALELLEQANLDKMAESLRELGVAVDEHLAESEQASLERLRQRLGMGEHEMTDDDQRMLGEIKRDVLGK